MLFLARPIHTFVILCSVLAPVAAQAPLREPLSFALDCPSGDCPLLKGTPQSAGMRSGFVRLKPGQSVGRHSTGQNEESLVILRGQGEVLFEGHSKRTFAAPTVLYIPPATQHNVTNIGREILEYVYVVAPAATK